MKIKQTEQGVLLSNIELFDLEQTLDCGQCFRFNKQQDEKWKGVVLDKPLTVYHENNNIIFQDVDIDEFEKFWIPYFDLNRDYVAIQTMYLEHPALEKAAKFAPGIRILKQDPWETLISFIISQNNNIKRIKGIIERLCENFGKPLPNDSFAFPTSADIAKLNKDDLQVLRAGWRWEYILDAAARVESGEVNLEEIRNQPIEKARKSLQIIKGVGPKVAECVLLFGMGKLEAFPLDVWMKRAMQTVFKGSKPEDFGEYAGIAQQYIFHYARNNPEKFKIDK